MPVCTPYVDSIVPGKVLDVTSATRPTGANLYEGRIINEGDTDNVMFYTGSAWVAHRQPWTAYTPTFTNLTIGTGTQAFYYRRSDGWMDIKGVIMMGSTFPSGLVGISYPITSGASASSISGQFVRYDDADTFNVYGGWASTGLTTRIDLYSFNASAAAAANFLATSSTSPFTWAAGDTITIGLRVRMTSRTS